MTESKTPWTATTPWLSRRGTIGERTIRSTGGARICTMNRGHVVERETDAARIVFAVNALASDGIVTRALEDAEDILRRSGRTSDAEKIRSLLKQIAGEGI